ncbi:DNA N-6-adenine-methyltransferase [Pseudomonas putida]|uniref:DNA N-6-adenine-methyltransferase n=1 Tax=Pseudomonas putida TaxID=303 RepID=UPI003FD1261D
MTGMIGARAAPPKHKSVEWYTPAWIFDRLGLQFDFDPSSPHDFVTAVPAKTKYTIFDDGLSKQWTGRVWMNPPYGPDTGFWMRRLIAHGDGIALVFSRTDAEWFQEAMASASAPLLIKGRIAFVPGHENSHKKGRSGAGSAMFAFGDECAIALQGLADLGVLVPRIAAWPVFDVTPPNSTACRCRAGGNRLTKVRRTSLEHALLSHTFFHSQETPTAIDRSL